MNETEQQLLKLTPKTDQPKQLIEPCPFCGTVDVGIYFEKITDEQLEKKNKSQYQTGLSYIWCHNCGVQTKTSFNIQENLDTWNRREASSNLKTVEMVAMMRDEIVEMMIEIQDVLK